METLREKLRTEDRVCIVRFGDNDIYHIAGKEMSGAPLYPGQKLGNNQTAFGYDLQHDLRVSLQIDHPNYLRAAAVPYAVEEYMEPGLLMGLPNHICAHYLQDFVPDNTIFYNPTIFSYYALFHQDEMQDFLNTFIRPKRTAFIGGNHYKPMTELFGLIDYYIPTPLRTAYDAKDEILMLIKSVFGNGVMPDVVILAAGQLGRVLAGVLWRLGLPMHILDIGSWIDAIAERQTRVYLHEHSHVIREAYT